MVLQDILLIEETRPHLHIFIFNSSRWGEAGLDVA